MSEKIRAVLREMPKLVEVADAIGDDDDLWAAGMDSLTSVRLLLRLEDDLGVELPDSELTRETFRCISALRAAFARCGAESLAGGGSA